MMYYILMVMAMGAAVKCADLPTHEAPWQPKPSSARATQKSQVDLTKGWTPKPTPPPGAIDDARVVIELLKGRQTANTWENGQTCGWFASVSSSAFLCAASSTCATNQQNVVACTSGTAQPFFTVCLDYDAYSRGACSNANSATGCCEQSTLGSCGTLLWEADPPRSMYRCFAAPTIIYMLDAPSTTTSPTKTVAPTTAIITTTSIGTTIVTTTQPGVTLSPTTTASSATAAPPTTTASPTTSSSISTTSSSSTASGGSTGGSANLGAIVGGVVGGVAVLGLAAALIAFIIYYKRRHPRPSPNPDEHDHVLPNHEYSQQPPSSTSPDMSQSQHTGGSTFHGYPGGATTYPPTSPYGTDPHRPQNYPPSNEVSQNFHRDSVYSPQGSPPPPQPQQQQQWANNYGDQAANGRESTPTNSPGLQSTYNPHHSTMSAELANSPPPAGHAGNPAEMDGHR